MQPIVAPLNAGETGPQVAILQDALRLFLERNVIRALDPPNSPTVEELVKLGQGLTKERTQSIYGKATHRLVLSLQLQEGLGDGLAGEVEAKTAALLNRLLKTLGVLDEPSTNEFTVKGVVTHANGKPAVGVEVRAFDRDLRTREQIGEMTVTGIDGRYEIGYSQAEFLRAEKDSADLMIRAEQQRDGGTIVVESPTLFNAPSSAIVDVTIPADAVRPVPLFEKIRLALEPLLGGLRVEELEEDKEHQDLSFLFGDTGFEKATLARFVLAHRLAQQGIRAEFWFVLLGGPFYQFAQNQSLKEQLATVSDALQSIDAALLRKALARGFNQQEIAEVFRENVTDWVDAFFKLIAKRSVSESDKPTFVKLALEDASIIGAEKQEIFARLFNEHKAITPDFLSALEKVPSFTGEEIDDLRTSFRLAELTQADFSVVKMLKNEFGVRRTENIRALAKQSVNEWVNLIKGKHTSGVITLPIETSDTRSPAAEEYGKTLERQFREAFPTTAFLGGLERAIENGGAKGLKRPADVSRFMTKYPGFELLNTPVDEFLNRRIDPDFQVIARDEKFRQEVKAVQRVFKLAPTFEATDAMLADGVHSAQMAYRMGESEFVRSYGKRQGFTPETAREIWNRATDTYAAALTLTVTYLSPELMQKLIGGYTYIEPTPFPNWNNLFQAGDICECEHCRSVLSPAAYFADLLMFLKDRKANDSATTVKDILFKRRADLGFLELNCANALTPFPYIDAVCEVLEDAIDTKDENDLELEDLTAILSNIPTAKDAITQAFENAFADKQNTGREKIDLGPIVSISQVSLSDPNRWVVHGENVTYLLKKRATKFFAEIVRNTKASAAELRAYPQYVNPKAYEKLREAKYPLSLPFDLFAEEVRAAFQKINMQRWDLMRTLRGTAAPNNATEGEIAAEYFGISTDPVKAFDEKHLILTANATVPGQQAVWGIAGASWLTTVANVKNFLQKTGLEYNELLALLDLQFINPKKVIAIQHLDASCDTDKKVIQGLDDVIKLDRIHRFLRLWRKLKSWKMWELDLVIRQSGVGDPSPDGTWLLNETFLINLFYLSRLKTRLGGNTTVEQVSALFGDLNTETRFTKLHQKREEGLYQTLFLNKRLVNPLDPDFDVDKVTVLPPPPPATMAQITAHHSVVLAALGLGEADLILLKELTKPSGAPYITDDLTLSNLSFLWRHAWLSKQLKFKAEEWKLVLKVCDQDIGRFANPKAAWEFVEKVDHLKAAGFTPDELNWLLAADRSARAATKEPDATRFFTTLRKELNGIQARYATSQYDFLTSGTNEEQLTRLVASLLQELNRDDAAVADILKTIRGSVSLEVRVALPSFAFPPAIANVDRIPIRYVESGSTLRFTGLMTEAQRTELLDDTKAAVLALRQSVRLEAEVQGGLGSFTFPTPITAAGIAIQYVAATRLIRMTGLLTAAQRTILSTHPSLPATVRTNLAYQEAVDQLYQRSLVAEADYRNAIEDLYQQSRRAGSDYVSMARTVALPAGFTFPATITGVPNGTAIRYEPTEQVMRFTGVMTAAQYIALTDPALMATAGSAVSTYREAIDEFFNGPLLDVKFFDPVFTAPLTRQPSEVDFKTQLLDQLAAKIAYDPEQRLLRFSGIMNPADKARILALSGDAGYVAAVNSLAAQPLRPPAAGDGRIWLTEGDLDLTQPGNETYGRRLSNAARKLLEYLSRAAVENAVVGQSSTLLGLTEAVTRRVLTFYAIVPISPPPIPPVNATLLAHLAGNFTVDRTTLSAWFWANRVAAILKRWKLTLVELERLSALATGARLLDFLDLPLDHTGPMAPLTAFLRTSRLIKLRDALSVGDITLLEVLEKLNSGAYAATMTMNVTGLPPVFVAFPATVTTGPDPIPIEYAAGVLRFTGQMTLAHRSKLLSDPSLSAVTGIASYRQAIEELFRGSFAGDVERMNQAWPTTHVASLVESLDLVYPADYLLAESWERLRLAFSSLGNLNAAADTAKTFAAAAMNDTHAKMVKELLRSKFGTETWLTLIAEIQDVLRERKRDALIAYLLTKPMPADALSGKWNNANDLYAYYLLDVEMSSCQMTSRLVQGSGSIQLFVQRCFMGLEPDVVVQADSASDDGTNGDSVSGTSAWRWWAWIRKYRVWEANRKVFLWPENWIEPELKKDRSSFFKDMENELLQNEMDQYTAETAFANYLEKLDGVAQLEIAGLYQEDNGNSPIVHVFGRTAGAEPHLYYYRRYDYRQWTPWEKIDLDIQEDYLIPAVVNQRLFLFWPVFTEVPDEAKNGGAIKLPTIRLNTGGDERFTPDRVHKRLRLQMAVSEYRQGKWSPKKVSTDFAESADYEYEIVRKQYRFFIDRGVGGGDFCIRFDGYSLGNPTTIAARNAAARKEYEDAINTATTRRDEAFRVKEDARIKRDAASEIYRIASDAHDELQRHLEYLVRAQESIFKLSPLDAIEAFVNLGVIPPLDNTLQAAFGIARAREKDVQQAPNDIARGLARLALEAVLTPLLPIRLGAIGILEVMIGNAVKKRDGARTTRDEIFVQILDPAQTKLDEAQRILAVAQAELDGIPSANLDNNNKPLALFSPGCFEVFGCKGVPELLAPSLIGEPIRYAIQPEDTDLAFLKWVKNRPDNGFALNMGEGVLKETPWTFKITFPWHVPSSLTLPFFYNDKGRTFFVLSSIKLERSGTAGSITNKKIFQLSMTRKFHFKNFYHPLVCDFAKSLYNPLKGIPALMSRETQLKNTGFSFERIYQPTDSVVKLPSQYPSFPDCYPNEIVDFSPDGAYSSYNWELFFHAPLLIANSLSKNQRFEEARNWYHYIFNPIGVQSQAIGASPMSKYWITKPFFETSKPHYVQQRIDNVLRMLAGDTNVPGYSAQVRKDLEDQVLVWRTNPFEPHRIANYRTVAYQKTVVMKYLDNLIAWGDNLFRQDSMESINEATQLYILAAEILGPRPKKVPPHANPPVESFNELEKEFDKFSNALVEVENLVPPMSGNGPGGSDPAPLPTLYFCIPQNDKLLGYWDTVADRLSKIHHCMNIEGVVRPLALFEPPIDPALLVKAVAAGVDISSALADLNAPLPRYRFNVLVQKANEVCNDVKVLGGALVAALEKKDSETLGLLRQSQEIRLLEAVKTVREKQIEEAKENLEGLKKSKAVIETRRDYYKNIEKIIAGEQLSLNKLATAHTHQDKAQEINIAASMLGYLPNVTIGASGFGGSPHVTVQWGTGNIISALQAASGSEIQLSNIASYDANRAATLAGYDRRYREWKMQETLAERELSQIDKQIAGAELRRAIAEKELENHILQVENAKATDAFMRSKYTNLELYQWQVGQISTVYFQSYKLAYDLAKRAERCFRFELGLQNSSYIQFGYWDSLKKGLLSGEKLQYDLRRLETAYLEQNRREFELTKHISLALLDPLALVKLRETGRCFFNLPEEVFDLDYPGHYFRRIKSVSLTLPCVVGPYTTVSCTLRLLMNSIRINTNTTADYPRNTEAGLPTDDDRFIENNIPVKAIAASTGQNDSGIFELSFRDERYLPFEGAGVISVWSLELFNDEESSDFGRDFRLFDYSTISDAILHVKYTAREDPGPFKTKAIAHLRNYFSQGGPLRSWLALDLRRDFGTEWSRFLNPVNAANGNVYELKMSTALFPLRDATKTLKINAIVLLARCTKSGDYGVTLTLPLAAPPPPPAPPPVVSNSMVLAKTSTYGGLHFGQKDVTDDGIELLPTGDPVVWRLKVTPPNGESLIEDLILMLGYEWN